MRSLGLDLGNRRIGVAVSDSDGLVATPYWVVERSGDPAADRREIARLVHEVGAGRVVVGLPLSLDGTMGPAAEEAMAEIEALRSELEVPVDYHDERLTTVSAQRSLSRPRARAARQSGEQRTPTAVRRQVIDKVAAAVILQAWLDSHR